MSIIARITYGGTYVSGTQTIGGVFIELRDATTGQLTNGNNVPVSYDMNINGTVTEGTAIVAGQSQQIYFGTLTDSDPAHLFGAKLQQVASHNCR